MSDTSDRLERERSFHDERFADDSARAAAGRFYDLAAGATASYAATVSSVPPDSRALEYGAGTGGQGLGLAQQGVEVLGIDISPVAVATANQRVVDGGIDPARCRYVEMDAEHLDLPDSSFDLVFGSGILHHLDLDRSLAEISRVLADDGTAVFFEPMGHNPAINLYRRFTPSMRSPDEHPLLMSDLRAASAWFGSVDAELHVLSTFAAVPFRRTARYGSMIAGLNRLDRRLFTRLPALARYGWIVVLVLRDPRPSDAEPGSRRPAV
jgi:SAM-dependent methyltransferase